MSDRAGRPPGTETGETRGSPGAGTTPLLAADDAFDPTLTMDEVLAAVKPFVKS
ncbi:MAG: hypothetical protein ACXWFH_09270 [Solirubrobacterales bacterium]